MSTKLYAKNWRIQYRYATVRKCTRFWCKREFSFFLILFNRLLFWCHFIQVK